MAEINYIAFPTSYKMLGEELNRMVAAYQSKEITEGALREAVIAWKTNVPNLLLDEAGTALAPGLMRHIGKKRGQVAFWALNSQR